MQIYVWIQIQLRYVTFKFFLKLVVLGDSLIARGRLFQLSHAETKKDRL